MDQTRIVESLFIAEPVIEGAGVHLKRVFGHLEAPQFDPFLLLDDFHSDIPEKYRKGFPWHPHRGIETISYILEGRVEHGDSMGNKGIIGPGDVQWMTAGNGIVHQEMPEGDEKNRLWGFQLWANLPASHKMMSPRYQEIKADQIPTATLESNVTAKVICGKVNDVEGPVTDIVIEPRFLDITVPEQTVFELDTEPGHRVFAYVIEGEAFFDKLKAETYPENNLVLYNDGDSICIRTQDTPVRFLLVSGRPINEPVVWQGPIVMNTQEELATAFREYRDGTFLKHDASS